MYTIELSQGRANAVLGYILNNQYYENLPKEKQDEIRFWTTANGLGSGRMLDSDGNYIFLTKKNTDKRSRRVEFKIVTKSEELINEVINSSLNK